MSVFDLPRLHFAGAATTALPSGPRNGLVDLTTHSAIMDGERFSHRRPVAEYHDYLDRVGGKGDAFGGNGYFAIQAEVTGAELHAGEVDTSDLVVGRAVDVWGHYNEYLATTCNRARIFDVDPASNWTSTLMIGQFGFGRAGRSHDVGYMFTGAVHGVQPPRWHRHGQVVHQFVVRADDMAWLDSTASSATAGRLRELVETGAAGGLVVQFALYGAKPSPIPNVKQWGLRGTIAPWRDDEPMTSPGGRLLTPRFMSVDVRDHQVVLNLIAFRAPDGVVDLRLRTSTSPGVAVPTDSEHCVVTVAHAANLSASEPLYLVGTDLTGAVIVLGHEEETTLVVDHASLFLEPPRPAGDSRQDVEVAVRSFVRGVPAPVSSVHVRQFFNPRAFPLDRRASDPLTRPEDIEVVRFSADGERWSGNCVIATDERGRGRFIVRGARAGTTRLLLTPNRETPFDGLEAAAAYDNDDELGLWPAVSSVAVRVLPDHGWMDDVPDDEVTFDLVYSEVFAFYELLHSFMSDEVFSLADRFRVETHPRLIWQMCDPRNRAKTYYMPPTRDLTGPQARLLLKYLRARHKEGVVPTVELPLGRSVKRITTRAQLVGALQHGVTIELAAMLQYLYAAFSIPIFGAGQELVRRGDWTPEQLELLCGDGGETADGGVRGSLIKVAREEMIHFLMVNNILMAIGGPFHVPEIDFGTINHSLMVPLDFSLEAFGLGSVLRFIQIEEPARLVSTMRLGELPSPALPKDYHYSSLSELYSDVREGLQRIPGLFLTGKGRGGGEHHLFLRQSLNTRYPDYQLEVDDLPSALFAIDVVTEQGEGGALTDGGSGEESHYDTFTRVAQLLMKDRLGAAGKGRTQRSLAYPVTRNPTMNKGGQAKELVTDPVAREVMVLFNESYFMMLQLMIQHFGGSPDASLRRSKLMNAAIDVMTGVMRPLAELLVIMPSGRPGRTAGPSFEISQKPEFISRPDVARRLISLRFQDLAEATRKCSLSPGNVIGNLEFLADQFAKETR
jgi:chromopyrrolic acid synthase